MTSRTARWFACSIGAVLFGVAAAGNLRAAETGASLEKMTVPGINYAVVKLPAGVVVMGQVNARPTSDEGPATRVTLTQPFWIGVTEVTVAQWKYFTATTGYITEAERA